MAALLDSSTKCGVNIKGSTTETRVPLPPETSFPFVERETCEKLWQLVKHRVYTDMTRQNNSNTHFSYPQLEESSSVTLV